VARTYFFARARRFVRAGAAPARPPRAKLIGEFGSPTIEAAQLRM